MQTIFWLVLTLLIVSIVVPSAALAESPLPSDMLREVSPEVNSFASYAIAVAPPRPIPDAPVRQKVIDKKFISVMAALGGAETLRLTTHKLVLDHAGAPWVTSVPSTPHFAAKYAGIYAAELLLAYELKKPHSWLPGDKLIQKFWWAYPAAMVPVHIKNGVRSIRTQDPSGCPVADCQQ